MAGHPPIRFVDWDFNVGPSGSTTVSVPATVVAGQYALLAACYPTSSTPTTPTGWTVVSSTASTGGASNIGQTVYGKKLVTGDLGTTLSVTMTPAATIALDVGYYDGVHATTPVDTSVNNHTTADISPTSGAPFSAPALTPSGAQTMNVWFFGIPANLGVTLNVTPTTLASIKRINVGGAPNIKLLESLNPGTSALTGNIWFTSGGSTSFVVVGVALKPATVPSAPTNDNFASATTISGSSGTTTGSTVGATIEATEPVSGVEQCSVWYTYTPGASGNFEIDTIGSALEDPPGTVTALDTVLYVYSGSALNALTQLATDNNSGGDIPNATESGGTTSKIASVSLTAGTTYRIAVRGFNQYNQGDVTLNWVLTVPVPKSGSDSGTAIDSALLHPVYTSFTGTDSGLVTETASIAEQPIIVPTFSYTRPLIYQGIDLGGPDYIDAYVVDMFGHYQAPIESRMVKKVTWELNGPGAAELDISNLDPVVAELLLTGKELLIVFRNFTPPLLWWGFVAKRSMTPGAQTFNLEGLESYFKLRIVEYGSLIYTNWDQLDIAANLMDVAQQGPNYDRNIRHSFSPSGYIRSRGYARDQHKIIFDAVHEFDADKLKSGFDSEITVDLSGNRRWTPYYPQKGTLYQDVLEWGNQIVGYDFKDDFMSMRTKVYATGGTDGVTKFEQVFEDVGASQRFGALVGTVSDGSETDIGWLLAKATQQVQARSRPIPTYSVTIAPNWPGLGTIRTGDIVRVRIFDGATRINDFFRVGSITWNQNETITLTFLGPNLNGFSPPSLNLSSLAGLLGSVDSRIAALEAQLTSPSIMPFLPTIQIPTLVSQGTFGTGGGGGGTTNNYTTNVYQETNVIYSLAGLLVSSLSPPVRPRSTVNVTGFSANLGTAGTSSTTVVLYKNGSSVTTLTIAAGSTFQRNTLSPVTYVAGTDSLQVGVTSSGTGAADLAGEVEVS